MRALSGAGVILAAVLMLAAGCEKADFNEPKKTDKADTTAVNPAGLIVSVSELMHRVDILDEDTTALDSIEAVRGYIVGVVDGLSMRYADFEPPFSVQSNLLIADDPMEYQINLCIPVQLPAGTKYRRDLNLEDNPENFGRCIILEGEVTSYFSVVGLKGLTGYRWDDGSKGETENGKDSLPKISDDSQLIHGGR